MIVDTSKCNFHCLVQVLAMLQNISCSHFIVFFVKWEKLITKQSQKYKLYHNLWYSCLFQNSIGNRLDVQKNTYSCIAPMHNLNVVAATPFLLRIKEATTSHDYCYYYAQCYDECEHIETLFFFNPISGARGGAVIHCSTYCIGLHNTPGAHGNECCHVFLQ